MKTLLTIAAAVCAASSFAREVVDFCDGWEFSRDQKTWRAVDVPHDWAIEGPFNPEANAWGNAGTDPAEARFFRFFARFARGTAGSAQCHDGWFWSVLHLVKS